MYSVFEIDVTIENTFCSICIIFQLIRPICGRIQLQLLLHFIIYNLSVERLFSYGAQIFISRRNGLSDIMFDNIKAFC